MFNPNQRQTHSAPPSPAKTINDLQQIAHDDLDVTNRTIARMESLRMRLWQDAQVSQVSQQAQIQQDNGDQNGQNDQHQSCRQQAHGNTSAKCANTASRPVPCPR